MTRELLPSQIGCIDLEWLEQQIEFYKKQSTQSREKGYLSVAISLEGNLNALYQIRQQLFPLTPLLEDAYMKGFKDAMYNDCKDFETYIQSPIKINTNES